jgi:hypothetical protein
MNKGSMLKSKKFDLYVIVVDTPQLGSVRQAYELKIVKTDDQLGEDFEVGTNYKVISEMIEKCYQNAV